MASLTSIAHRSLDAVGADQVAPAQRRSIGRLARGLGLVLLAWTLGCEPANEVATIQLGSGGTIRIRLRADKAPQTVNNFKKLANEGFYDGTTFHLAIPSFMIQGGDPNTKNDRMVDDGYGGPGYTIPDEFSDLAHVRGAVSMANSRQPNTGGSQFFIIAADTGPDGENWSEELDGKYAVFGEVIEGMDEVDRISKTPTGGNEIPGQQYRPDADQVVESIRVTPG